MKQRNISHHHNIQLLLWLFFRLKIYIHSTRWDSRDYRRVLNESVNTRDYKKPAKVNKAKVAVPSFNNRVRDGAPKRRWFRSLHSYLSSRRCTFHRSLFTEPNPRLLLDFCGVVLLVCYLFYTIIILWFSNKCD